MAPKRRFSQLLQSKAFEEAFPNLYKYQRVGFQPLPIKTGPGQLLPGLEFAEDDQDIFDTGQRFVWSNTVTEKSIKAGKFGQKGNWVPKKLLGRGGFGIAYLWEMVADNGETIAPNNTDWVVKNVVTKDEKEGNRWDPLAIGNEAKMLFLTNQLKCPSIIKLLRYLRIKNHHVHRHYLEYCPHGDLHGLGESYRWGFNDTRNHQIPEAFVWSLFYDLALAIVMLQHGGSKAGANKQWTPILHLDLKPQNVFLGFEKKPSEHVPYPQMKLADFGLAQHYALGLQIKSTGGTAGFIAPEQMGWSLALGPRVNVYGVGLTIWRFLMKSLTRSTMLHPTKIEDVAEHARMIFSEELTKLLSMCMHPNARKRPRSVTVLEVCKRNVDITRRIYRENLRRGPNQPPTYPPLLHEPTKVWFDRGAKRNNDMDMTDYDKRKIMQKDPAFIPLEQITLIRDAIWGNDPIDDTSYDVLDPEEEGLPSPSEIPVTQFGQRVTKPSVYWPFAR
ncbi:MAG: hypothetical protein M1814_000465 [Vezdaea aestivalis]|nr:MAG: hypothetical protein M1814_000465 [Vezdaea aestivalis]